MDDAPLLGEPGSFIIGKTSTEPLVVGMRQPVNSEASKAPTPAGVGGSMSKPGTPAATGTTTALSAIKTDPATIGVGKTGKGGEKSPTTPGGMKERTKRRKSKILSTAVVSSATGPGAGVS